MRRMRTAVLLAAGMAALTLAVVPVRADSDTSWRPKVDFKAVPHYEEVLGWGGKIPAHCVEQACSTRYPDNPLGGLGVEPRRTYVLDYDGSPVCVKIRDAMNAAIADPDVAWKKVIRPMPRKPDPPQNKGDRIYAPARYWEGLYQAKNPLFADDMFLAWSYLDGEVADSSTKGSIVFRPAAFDHNRARWLIVPLAGHRYLVTRGALTKGRPEVWDVPEGDLDRQDWSSYKSYQAYKGIWENPWKDRYPDADPVNPVTRFAQLYPSGPDILIEKYPPDTPKAPKLDEPASIWRGAQRGLSIADFARIDGRVYLILTVKSRNDLKIVADVEKTPGDDLCYLHSRLR